MREKNGLIDWIFGEELSTRVPSFNHILVEKQKRNELEMAVS